MSVYSIEDKIFIEQFVTQNSLDAFSTENEEKWQELGNVMNRNWEDIRKMYKNWKIQNDKSESANELKNNDQRECQNLDFVIDELLSTSESEMMNQYVNIDGQWIKTDQLHYIFEATLPIQSINNINDSSVQSLSEKFSSSLQSNIQSSSEKRPIDVLRLEANSDFVKIFEKQSLQELEFKRQEHEEKMMVYRQQLIQGAEVHKERMKLLRAKLRAIEEKVDYIDSTICNRNLKKKFKNGSI
ncbi:uncharacterized protein LOC131671285 isoform X1 [Phymastichus coffea]|uniref:uncharacterized protein LOC131671285 isoform X1 n=2 Tax=Phymastichus coffea TaxID=108790 RepID=UPI00273A9FCE|nr:uncharacterized protein LOC131671285 isoform X1 [Phymastichus coffea]